MNLDDLTKRLAPFPTRQVVYGETTPEPFANELTQTELELRALFGEDTTND